MVIQSSALWNACAPQPPAWTDELAVVRIVTERLKIGRVRSGTLPIATDRRDFGVEALEEAADGLVYVAAALMRGGR